MNLKYQRRVTNIPISDAQAAILRATIPYGMQKVIFKILVDCLCEELSKDAPRFLAEIMVGKIDIKKTMKLKDLPDGHE